MFVNQRIDDLIKARPEAVQPKAEAGGAVTEDQKQLIEWAQEARRQAFQETTASG